MLKKIIVALLSLCLSAGLAVAAVLWLAQSAQQQQLNIQQEQFLAVEAGSTPVALLQRLEAAGIIQGELWLRLAWRLKGTNPRVQVGEYRLTGEMSLADLLSKWSSGDVQQYKIALIEGRNFAQIRTALAANPYVEQSIGELSDAQVMQKLGLEGKHPEGQFYADTYQFARGQKDIEILRQANQRLHKVLEEEWQQRAENLPYTDAQQALIMASIIEKETGAAHERAQIAGVFVRRLQKRMLLQTDPTVIYGMGERYQGKIRRSDLRENTPYNTYVHPGLPPTPIAMVGREAIHAALHPEPGSSLYFVAKGDGTHQFSNTLNEHNRAVRKYQLQRSSDYRSTVQPVGTQP